MPCRPGEEREGGGAGGRARRGGAGRLRAEEAVAALTRRGPGIGLEAPPSSRGSAPRRVLQGRARLVQPGSQQCGSGEGATSAPRAGL